MTAPREHIAAGEWADHSYDDVALTVCIEHGAFVPCRKKGEHHTTQNPYWVKAVRDYQTSTIPGLTWEPAGEYARRNTKEVESDGR